MLPRILSGRRRGLSRPGGSGPERTCRVMPHSGLFCVQCRRSGAWAEQAMLFVNRLRDMADESSHPQGCMHALGGAAVLGCIVEGEC